MGAERRACVRRALSGRSAVWLDSGPHEGVLARVFDLSMCGFAIDRPDDGEDALIDGKAVFCVLLFQGVHIDCLARVASARRSGDGRRQIGFRIEVLATENTRLLAGVLGFLDAEGEVPACPSSPEEPCLPASCDGCGEGAPPPVAG